MIKTLPENFSELENENIFASDKIYFGCFMLECWFYEVCKDFENQSNVFSLN